MKKTVLACLAALAFCSGCVIFDDDFIEDEPDAYFSSAADN